MKKIILTEADKKQIVSAKEKAILESFAKTFNKIKRLDESELNEEEYDTNRDIRNTYGNISRSEFDDIRTPKTDNPYGHKETIRMRLDGFPKYGNVLVGDIIFDKDEPENKYEVISEPLRQKEYLKIGVDVKELNSGKIFHFMAQNHPDFVKTPNEEDMKTINFEKETINIISKFLFDKGFFETPPVDGEMYHQGNMYKDGRVHIQTIRNTMRKFVEAYNEGKPKEQQLIDSISSKYWDKFY